MATREIHTRRWYADASAVEFLDLSVREFHFKKTTTPIYALDLSAARRIYWISSWPRYVKWVIMRKDGKLPLHETVCHCGNTVPSVRLIEIFVSNILYPTSFFDDFSRNIFQKLETKWEPEIMRLYLKHLKVYTHYTKNALFDLHTFEFCQLIQPIPYPSINILPRLYAKNLILDVTPKLIKFLFDNDCPDSTLVEKLFHTVCIDARFLSSLLVKSEPEIIDYILHHLKKAKHNINYIFKSLLIHFKGFHCFSLKPETLRVHLNYGVENIIKKWWHTQLLAGLTLRIFNHSIKNFEKLRAMPDTRESQILLMLIMYLLEYPRVFTAFMDIQRILWKTMPFAVITHNEMRDVIIRYFGNQFAEANSSKFQSYLNGFETVLQPRSLAHFSRCVIRHKLINTSQMPEGIGLLGLPSRLQSYLRLEL